MNHTIDVKGGQKERRHFVKHLHLHDLNVSSHTFVRNVLWLLHFHVHNANEYYLQRSVVQVSSDEPTSIK